MEKVPSSVAEQLEQRQLLQSTYQQLKTRIQQNPLKALRKLQLHQQQHGQLQSHPMPHPMQHSNNLVNVSRVVQLHVQQQQHPPSLQSQKPTFTQKQPVSFNYDKSLLFMPPGINQKLMTASEKSTQVIKSILQNRRQQSKQRISVSMDSKRHPKAGINTVCNPPQSKQQQKQLRGEDLIMNSSTFVGSSQQQLIRPLSVLGESNASTPKPKSQSSINAASQDSRFNQSASDEQEQFPSLPLSEEQYLALMLIIEQENNRINQELSKSSKDFRNTMNIKDSSVQFYVRDGSDLDLIGGGSSSGYDNIGGSSVSVEVISSIGIPRYLKEKPIHYLNERMRSGILKSLLTNRQRLKGNGIDSTVNGDQQPDMSNQSTQLQAHRISPLTMRATRSRTPELSNQSHSQIRKSVEMKTGGSHLKEFMRESSMEINMRIAEQSRVSPMFLRQSSASVGKINSGSYNNSVSSEMFSQNMRLKNKQNRNKVQMMLLQQ